MIIIDLVNCDDVIVTNTNTTNVDKEKAISEQRELEKRKKQFLEKQYQIIEIESQS